MNEILLVLLGNSLMAAFVGSYKKNGRLGDFGFYMSAGIMIILQFSSFSLIKECIYTPLFHTIGSEESIFASFLFIFLSGLFIASVLIVLIGKISTYYDDDDISLIFPSSLTLCIIIATINHIIQSIILLTI